MDDARWAEMVERLERSAERDPRGYRRRVGLLATLGYAYLLLAVLTLVGLGALVVLAALSESALLFKLLFPVGALLVVVLRACWVRLEPPDGVPLERSDAPALFALVDDVRSAVGGPAVHAVLVDGDLNASVSQVPRLGVVGRAKNYLLLGLPLLDALPPDEFTAVLAHEFGHLSGSHGRFSAWIYRIRLTWLRLLVTLEERRQFGTFAFRWFFEWYAPYFNTYSFVLARAQEYEADRAAADATSNDAAARALVRVQLAAAYLEDLYWPSVYAAVAHEARPSSTPFTSMSAELRGVGAGDRAAEWARVALEEAGDPTDTHPPLAARLAALAVEPDGAIAAVRASPPTPAAERYLGTMRDKLLARLDDDWRAAVQLGWHEHHEETMRRRRRLEELSQKAQDGTSSIDEDVERATIIEELDADDPLPVLLDVVARSPEHALARFDAGRLLLARGDESGIAHLEAAMTLDRDAVLPACELVARYLEEQGRSSHAATYRSRMDEHMTLLTEAHREREVIDGDEGLEPHGLAPELVERVVVELRRCEQVACAYLVRKRMRVLDDEHPVYLLVVVPRPGWRHAWRESEDDPPTLSDLITDGIDVPVDLRVVVPGLRSTLVVNAAAVTGALTYESP